MCRCEVIKSSLRALSSPCRHKPTRNTFTLLGMLDVPIFQEAVAHFLDLESDGQGTFASLTMAEVGTRIANPSIIPWRGLT